MRKITRFGEGKTRKLIYTARMDGVVRYELKQKGVKKLKRIFMFFMCLTLVITGVFAFPFQADAAGARWVLMDVVDYDGKSEVDHTNKGGVYEASSKSSPGSYSYTWKYLGEGDTYYDPDLLKGEHSTSECTFSTPPTTIQGGETVTLSMKLNFGDQLLSYYTDKANAGADFDKWDVAPGDTTGASVPFKNKDGKSSFKIDTYKTVKVYSVNDTLTAKAPTGAKEGDKIALRTTFNGVKQGTCYIYVWSSTQKPIDIPTAKPPVIPVKPKYDPVDPQYKNSGIRVSDLYGEVTIRRGDNEDVWELLELGSVIYVGDHIRTAGDSGCILSMLDMTTFHIKPESEIIITVPSGSESKIKLILGNIYTNFQEIITHGTMEVEMNQAVAGIKGTTFICEETGSKSTLKVLEGKVNLTSKKSGKSIAVAAGEMAVADASGNLNKSTFNIAQEVKKWDKIIIELIIDQKLMKVNGVQKEIDPGRETVPKVVNGRTLIPIRAVIEAMGGTADYDVKEQKITLKKGNDTLQMRVGKTNIKLNDSTKTMDTAPVVLNGRTMVPVRFVAENFGYSVAWKAAEQTVVIQ